MDGFFRSARRLGMLGVAALSIGAGIVLVHALVTPKQIQTVQTAGLLVIVALFVLPVLSIAALCLDRVVVRRRPHPRSASPDVRKQSAGRRRPQVQPRRTDGHSAERISRTPGV